MSIANDIMKNGDLTGMKTEQLTSLMTRRLNANELSGGKYYGNSKHGYDVVVENSYGTLIIESKQPTATGGTRLSVGAGGNVQLTEGWIEAVNGNIERFNNDFPTPASLRTATELDDGSLLKTVSVFDRNTGRLILVPVE